MTRYLIILLLAVLTSSAYSQAGNDAQVWARVDALNKAVFETKDSAAIQDLVADSLTYGHSTGVIENKPVMLHNAVHSAEVYSNLSTERLAAVKAGDGVIVRYILRGDVVKNADAYPLNIGVMQVWAKNNGKWRLFARQAVKVNPK
jgi:hypothetical protein